MRFKIIYHSYISFENKMLTRKCRRLSWKDSPEKLTFGRRGSRQGLTLLLLSDWLIVAKRKG